MLSYCRTYYHLTIIMQSLLEIVDSNLTRAQRDNDLIYHQDVPAASSLPVIQPASMVASVVSPELTEPKKILGNDNLIFGELVSWGAQTAIGTAGILLSPPFIDRVPEIYIDRRNTTIKEHIKDRSQKLNDVCTQ
jgi:programmed cell death 6-interacting protein